MSRLRRLATVLLEKDMRSVAPGLRAEMEAVAKESAASYPADRRDSFDVEKKTRSNSCGSDASDALAAITTQAEFVQATSDAALGQAGIADLPAYLMS